MGFKVGDIVTGNNEADYDITNKFAVMRVLQITDYGTILLKVLKSSMYYKPNERVENNIGEAFYVEERKFDYYIEEMKTTEEILEGWT